MQSIPHCNEDRDNVKGDISQLIFLRILSKEKGLGPQSTSPQWNGNTQKKTEHHVKCFCKMIV